MSQYRAPLDDIRFDLFDVLDVESVLARLGQTEVNRELVDAVLEEGARFTTQVLAPLNAIGDRGCTFDKATGDVATPEGFAAAYRQFVEGGWPGLNAPAEFGGQGMPHVLGAAIKEMIDAANLAWGNFPLLSHGATEALLHYGSEWQQETFLKPLVEGRWTGTMCLTEPHAGTDLGLLRTRATPNGDGSYAINGTKIFITAGEHDMAENIVHLVLAKLPDAPTGSRGISLFVVPKFKVGEDGAMGERNTLRCGALEHKMGIHGSATCVMNFDDAQGWLVGEPHKGLMAMFVMMNTARLAVGLQGLGLADRAYQNALRYARERLQMRALSGPKFPEKPADPIIVHPDVRRMLLTQKSLVEGGRLLAYHAFLNVDIAQHGADEAERAEADALVGFLTPIVKACLTEWGNECTSHALQCFGGHGYIAEHGMEQLARDARITTLYEGTTGVQALDLVGRKLLQLKGAGLRAFLKEAHAFCQREAANPALAGLLPDLVAKLGEWQALSEQIGQSASRDPEEVGGAAWDYLFYSGYVALAYWWARSVVACEGSALSAAAKEGKRETARFYFARILPRTLMHKAAIESGAGNLMTLTADAFD
ncbi:acyl-CoA dehydrogenase [Lysobacter oculi]|uniref:3-methylmercaptopropionyl-CoA dehydrogenase n=1 Tax=Solilutibacter oculi TaxID=2698682 RepID=A0A344J5W8_9GAMM|nr:acyl-CoA dehydrogenase C-terminal domain-containing protein [Lysobacter oculi]AXA84428.1 acyl-CoA dehydrogenase [Lysobacter oculi]